MGSSCSNNTSFLDTQNRAGSTTSLTTADAPITTTQEENGSTNPPSNNRYLVGFDDSAIDDQATVAAGAGSIAAKKMGASINGKLAKQQSSASHISIELFGGDGKSLGDVASEGGGGGGGEGSFNRGSIDSHSAIKPLSDLVNRMRSSEGLTVPEVELVCEVVRLGPAYISTYAEAHLEEPDLAQYVHGKAEAHKIYPSPSQPDNNVHSSFVSKRERIMSLVSVGDPFGQQHEGGGGGGNNNGESGSTQHRDGGRKISHSYSQGLYNQGSIAHTRASLGSSMNSSTGMEISTNDPDLAKKIQEGNRLVQRTWSEAYATPKFAVRLLELQRASNPELSDSVFYKINQSVLADKLGGMINDSIKMLDKPDAFIPVMMQLGVKHIMYGVGDDHLAMFREALFKLLKELLQPPRTQWDEALAKEWKRAFALMKSMMTQGRTTPQGMKESRRYNAQTHRMLLRCWKSVADREDTGLETSFVELLHITGGKVIGTERYDLFTNLIARRRMFMDMMTKLFEIGVSDSESIHLLRELGSRHVSYGLTKDDYKAYTTPFIDTVVLCARPSTVNPLVRHLLRDFWNRATDIMIDGSLESRCAFSLRQAPKGAPFAIVFTDIEGSTALWENQPVPMETAVDEHHKLMRDLIHDHNGYEVKTIGDSFMVAFKSLAEAVKMSLRLQVELLSSTVSNLSIDGTRCEASGPDNMWNPSAVRVRVGVHWCTDAAPKFDVVYKRYDYYGNDVNAASRVQDAACGGQVLCTSATLKALKAMEGAVEEECMKCGKLTSLYPDPKSTAKASLKDVLGTSLYMENAELKGLQDSVTLHSLYPKVLEGRVFGKRKKDVFTESANSASITTHSISTKV